MDWKKIRCNKCESFRRCRRDSISKGSVPCEVNLKIREPKDKDQPSEKAQKLALLSSLLQRGEKND